MAVTQVFQQAVQSGNVLSVRIMMKDSLLRDPSFKEFNEMALNAQNMTGLYDVHDGTEFNPDRSAWNDDYMSEVRIELVDNFSHERIAHLKEVIRYLHPYTQEEEKDLSRTSAEEPPPAVVGAVAAAGGTALTFGLVKAATASAVTAAAVSLPVGVAIGVGAGVAAAVIQSNHQNGGKSHE